MIKCKLPRCNEPSMSPGEGNRKRPFCCDDHSAIGKKNNTVRYRAKDQGKEAALCANPSCHFLFVKRYLEHELCYHCERSGFVVGEGPTGEEVQKEMPYNDMTPESHIDFRTKLCFWKLGGLCRFTINGDLSII